MIMALVSVAPLARSLSLPVSLSITASLPVSLSISVSHFGAAPSGLDPFLE